MAYRNPSVGDLGCGGVDVAAWRESNRVPVYPGQYQRWVITAILPDGTGESDARNACLEFLWEQFGESYHVYTPVLAAGTYRVGERVDLLRVSSIGAVPITIPSADRARRAQDLPEPPTLAGNHVTYFDVMFVWRGTERDVPWPTWSGGVLFGQSITDAIKYCPTGTSWMLYQASGPLGPAPEDQGQLGHVARGAGEALGDITKGAGAALGQFALGAWPLLLLLGLGIGAAVLARRAVAGKLRGT